MAEWFKAAALKAVVPSRVPWVRILLPPPTYFRRGDREAEGARLLSECAPKGAPWVRIPPSPPFFHPA